MRPEPTTVRPPFDPEEFARKSESSIRVNDGATPPPPSAKPTAPPPPGIPVYAAASGGDAIPLLVVSRDDLEWFELTPKARAMLAHVDGQHTVAAICSSTGLQLGDALEALEELAREGLVAFL
jgi:hypothetical protein